MGTINHITSLQIIIQEDHRNQFTKMMLKTVSLMALMSTISGSPLKTEVTKAASPYVNIGCQCSPLTFVDQYGTVQGNCRAADSTGARWCYIDNAYSSSCQDKRFSARFPNNPWSYEACATPPPPTYVSHVPAHVHVPAAPSAAFTAPVNTIPAHHHQHPASGGYQGGFQGIPNTGTLQPYGEFLPKSSNAVSSSSSSDAIKF